MCVCSGTHIESKPRSVRAVASSTGPIETSVAKIVTPKRMTSASRLERAFAHLLADGYHRWVGQRAALPVGAVDDECVAGDEAGVGRGEEGRRPPELLALADAQGGLGGVLVVGAG